MSLNSVGPKVVTIGGASLFKQDSASPQNKHKELTEFLQNSIAGKSVNINMVEKSGTQEGNKRRQEIMGDGSVSDFHALIIDLKIGNLKCNFICDRNRNESKRTFASCESKLNQ